MKNNVLVALTLAWLAAVGCGAPKAPTSADRAAAPVPAGGKILDVRTAAEFNSGHLKDAINVPVDVVAQRIAEVAPEKSTPLLVYCRSGSRSAMAKGILEKQGYTQVRDLGSLSAARAALAGQ